MQVRNSYSTKDEIDGVGLGVDRVGHPIRRDLVRDLAVVLDLGRLVVEVLEVVPAF